MGMGRAMADTDPTQVALKSGYRLHLVKDDQTLVVLMGWLGASDRNLAKYGQLLTSLGISHLRTIMPSEHVFWPFDGGRTRTARLILDTLLQTGLVPGRQLILWSFSNGGTYVYEEICKLLDSDSRYKPVQQAICGLMFDSAPSYMSYVTFHRALSLMVKPRVPAWTHLLVALLVWVPIILISLVTVWYEGFYPGRPAKYWRFLESRQSGVPELYLFSRTDTLTDARTLEKLIQTRSSRGNNVQSVEFERSPHCGHLKDHPGRYREAVQSFLQLTLSGSRQLKGVKKA